MKSGAQRRKKTRHRRRTQCINDLIQWWGAREGTLRAMKEGLL